MATEDNEDSQATGSGNNDLLDEELTYIDSVLLDDETPVAIADFDNESKLIVVTDLRVLILGEGSVLNLLNHDDIARMNRDGLDLVIETARGYEYRYGFDEDETVEEIVEIAEAAASRSEVLVAPDYVEDTEVQSGSESDRRSLLGRVVSTVKEKVSRSFDAITGADIRRFDDFTDATTRAVVGVHQDVADLREQVTRTERALDDLREDARGLSERVDRLEQSIGRRTGLAPWILVTAMAALVLSVVALLISVS